MAELYFPFASSGGDRMVGVETYERMLGSIFTQGVYPRGEMLAVTPAGGMNIAVHTGSAILVRDGDRASLYHNTTAQNFTLMVADGVAARIDTVIVRRDNAARLIGVMVVQGELSVAPIPAEPLRNNDYWDIVLCKIHIRAGATEITDADIEDCRMNNDLCGVVSSLAQLDSGKFYDQLKAVFDNWFVATDADYDAWFVTLQAEFDAWYQSIKDMLDEEVAMQLSAKIDVNAKNIANNTQKIDTLVKLPTVTQNDNGKFLRVVNGVWATATVTNAEEVAY